MKNSKNRKERVLFKPNYDMISEVTKLEELMPSYSSLLKKFGNIVRNKLWDESSEERLVFLLHTINNTLILCIDILGEYIEIIEFYISMLVKYQKYYAKVDVEALFDTYLKELEYEKTKEIFQEHWKYINPLLKENYDDNDFYEKNLIELLDDMLENLIQVCPEKFFCDKASLGILVRGRKGEYSDTKELYPPSIETAIDKKIINRWNPPDKRYNYLVIENGDSINAHETVLRELRSKSDEKYTICEFKTVMTSKTNSQFLINMDYQTIAIDDIWRNVQNKIEQIAQKSINASLKVAMDYDTKLVNFKEKDILKREAVEFAGKYLLSALCKAIFVPLDEDEDNDKCKKERCYKSFHILAEYFENKGYGGIVYPSTRMSKYGKYGVNVVLFDADAVEAIDKSIVLVNGID